MMTILYFYCENIVDIDYEVVYVINSFNIEKQDIA